MHPRLKEFGGCMVEAALIVGMAGVIGAAGAAAMYGWSLFLWWVSQ